jgi:hypothetical protein
MKKWQEFENASEYYYDDSDGMVIGHIHRFGNLQMIYTATVKPLNSDESLGHFVSRDYARRAVERFWEIQDRTLLE